MATHEEIKSKALDFISRGKLKHADNPDMVARLDRAGEIIESEGIIRLGYINPNLRYYVQSSAYTEGADWTKGAHDKAPWYLVQFSIEDDTSPHSCYCEDFKQGWDYHLTPAQWRDGNKGAPVLGEREQPWCKHLLAAFAVQVAREELGLSIDQERAEAWERSKARDEREMKDARARQDRKREIAAARNAEIIAARNAESMPA